MLRWLAVETEMKISRDEPRPLSSSCLIDTHPIILPDAFYGGDIHKFLDFLLYKLPSAALVDAALRHRSIRHPSH